MTITSLPFLLPAPHARWAFEGTWHAVDQALIEQTLRERIPNPARAHHDPWVFLAHAATYYAHSPTIHSPGIGFAAATAADLAELLWDHYFSLQLGPLAWSPPIEVAPQAIPTVALAAQAWAGQGDAAAATYNQRLASVSSCFRYALRHGLLRGENPIARVQRQRVQAYGKAVALTPAAVRQKLQAIDRSALDGLRDHALLAIALQTGRRLAEIAALTWSDLRFHDDGRATITFQRCKGGKTMRDTINETVSSAVRQVRAIYEAADAGQHVHLLVSEGKHHEIDLDAVLQSLAT